ncbi:ROK family transcriptional regulator [Streptomyces sp. T1317-0309]|nr:ROK family transcriptional regulator [Streptomyces sp. T1317-0309]
MTRRYPAGPQRLLRSLNGRAVLEAIDEAGPVTTTDLAGRIPLSRPTVAAAVGLLVERGVITEVGPATGRKGPAPAQYRVNADCAFGIGVDVGHRRIRAAVADVTGRIRARAETGQHGERGADALVGQVLEMCADLAGHVGRELQEITQVVAGLPAAVGPDGRRLSYAAGLPDAGKGLGEALGRAVPVPLVLENDVNLAALAERTHGLGTETDDFVLVSLGVGLGLGLVVDGRVRRGATGVAGEAGYLPSDRMIAPVGQRRDLVQEHLGARYISAEAQRLGLPGDGSPRGVFDLARAGDPGALAIVDDTARSVAYVVACVVPSSTRRSSCWAAPSAPTAICCSSRSPVIWPISLPSGRPSSPRGWVRTPCSPEPRPCRRSWPARLPSPPPPLPCRRLSRRLCPEKHRGDAVLPDSIAATGHRALPRPSTDDRSVTQEIPSPRKDDQCSNLSPGPRPPRPPESCCWQAAPPPGPPTPSPNPPYPQAPRTRPPRSPSGRSTTCPTRWPRSRRP